MEGLTADLSVPLIFLLWSRGQMPKMEVQQGVDGFSEGCDDCSSVDTAMRGQ